MGVVGDGVAAWARGVGEVVWDGAAAWARTVVEVEIVSR